MHIFFFFFHCGLLCCSSKLLQMTFQSLNTVYHIDFSPFLTIARILFLLHCLSVSWPSHNHCVYIQVRIFCHLCIWYGGVYFSWNVYCWSHGMDGVYSLLCKTMSVFVLMREMYLLFVPFEQLVQHVFWNRGISLQFKTVVAVYTVCCKIPFFFFFSKSCLLSETSSIHYVQ